MSYPNWWEEIREEVRKRNATCRLQGMERVYDLKGVNPYKYSDVHKFKSAKPLDVKKDCVLPRTIKHTLDKKGTYYKEANGFDCVALDGNWSLKSVNRLNKYDEGVCWKTEQDAKCAAVIDKDPILLRPRELSKKSSEYKEKLVTDKRRECRSTPGCEFKATTNGYDCFSKAVVDKLEGDVFKPPESMPVSPRDPDFEKFLWKWYNGKLEERAPSVQPLAGVGCSGNASVKTTNAEKDKKGPYKKRFTREQLKKMDPTKVPESMYLHSALGDEVFIPWYMQWVEAVKRKKTPPQLDWDSVGIYEDKDEEIQKEEVNAGPKGMPSIVQSVVNMVMKNIAMKNSTARGLLALHSTGSGKTCTATGVFDAFWDTKRDIVFVSSLDALASNPPYKFHECAKRLFPRWQTKTPEQIQAEFELRGVRFLSFAKLANRIVDPKKKVQAKDSVDLDNSVLVIDEVHNLFRPLPNQKEKHKIVERHLINVEMHPNLKMVVLTATPGDNVEDTMKLINMIRDPVVTASPIRPPTNDPKDLLRFREDIRGLISYYDLSNDESRFPLLIDSDPEKYPMTYKQFVKYFEQYNQVKKEWKDYDKLAKANQLGKWWVGARRYANMLYAFEKDMSLTEFSSKLPALLKNVEDQYKAKEKSYVYSAFHENRGSSHGILEIARQLDKLGWKKITVSDIKGGKVAPGKRYMIASQKEKDFDKFIKVYNSDENKYGELIGCMIATQNFNEGLDLKAVRHIHIFEPLVTMASDLQTLGRARRYCSHAALDKEKGEWTVKIWRYMATLGDYAAQISQVEKGKRKRKSKKVVNANDRNTSADGVVADIKNKSVDEVVFEEARIRYKQLFDITTAMKLSAIDALLTKSE